jgi:transcriptional regulator with XRE-family HTH domain
MEVSELDSNFRIEMGKRILGKRKSLRLSQEELAEKAETSKQTVSMAERGKRELSTQTAVKLATALGMSTDYLLTGKQSDIDSSILGQRISGLTSCQFKFLKGLIEKFVEMCEEDFDNN